VNISDPQHGLADVLPGFHIAVRFDAKLSFMGSSPPDIDIHDLKDFGVACAVGLNNLCVISQ
jgi:hypothetical protein